MKNVLSCLFSAARSYLLLTDSKGNFRIRKKKESVKDIHIKERNVFVSLAVAAAFLAFFIVNAQ